VLGDVPLLGKLFRSERKRSTTVELVILLRPLVITDADWPALVREPNGASASCSNNTIRSDIMTEPVRRKKCAWANCCSSTRSFPRAATDSAREQKRTGRKLGRVLADLKMVREEAFQELLAEHLQIPFVTCDR